MNNSNLKRIKIPCPVCDSERFDILYEPSCIINDPVKLYGAASGIPRSQRLVKCLKCNLIFENPRFPESVILDAYKKSKESGHDSQYSMRVNSFLLAMKSVSKYLPSPGAKVLDIGTAGGGFLEAAKKMGYEIYGLEPSQYLVKQGRLRGLPIEEGTIDDHPFKEGNFDLVCLWDVLEHLANPKEALIKISSLLKSKGILLINYPDIGTWMARLTGRRFWWILSVHLVYFSQETIKELAQRTGFKVIHFQRYWQILQFGYLQSMAIHYHIPLSKLLGSLTPEFIKRIAIPYYASQTTTLLRLYK